MLREQPLWRIRAPSCDSSPASPTGVGRVAVASRGSRGAGAREGRQSAAPLGHAAWQMPSRLERAVSGPASRLPPGRAPLAVASSPYMEEGAVSRVWGAVEGKAA